MRTLIQIARPEAGERTRLALAVALAAGATGAAIALLATSGYVISRAAQRPQIIALTLAIVGVRGFGIARAALRYAERLASHDLALRQLARLRLQFYRRLAPLVPGQLTGRGRGDLLSRFVGDVDTLQDFQLRVLIPALVAVVVIVGAGVAGWLMLGVGGGVLLVSLAAVALVSSWLSASVAAASGRNQAPVRAALTGQLVEAIDGSAELALAGRAREHLVRLQATDAQLARLGRRDAVASALAGGLQALLTGVGLLLVLLVGISAVRSGALAGVLLAAVAFLFLGAGEAIVPLPAAARRLRSCVAAAKRLAEINERVPAIADPAFPDRPSGSGPLALEGVHMRYGLKEDVVLDGIDLRVDPAEHVALVGPSGTGKTTLAELLVRFLDPVRGSVTLDGIDVRWLAQEDLRRAVLLCGQDAHLFNTTIRENLLIGNRDAPEDELWQVLEVVELTAFTAALPQGLDTFVGQQGELLSGGQRRRVALARALLADARYLILDEPTAHLDAPLARRVMTRVLERRSGRAVLVITHDLDALAGFDRVLTLDDGQLHLVPVTGHDLKGAAA